MCVCLPKASHHLSVAFEVHSQLCVLAQCFCQLADSGGVLWTLNNGGVVRCVDCCCLEHSFTDCCVVLVWVWVCACVSFVGS